MPLHPHLQVAIQRPCGDTPDDIADTVAHRLADAGYSIQRNVAVQPRRGAHDSIDIVATAGDTVIAIVVDRPKPHDTPPSRRSQRWHLRLIRFADRLQPRHSYHPAVISRRFRQPDYGTVAFGLCQ